MNKDLLKRQIVKTIASRITLGDYPRDTILPSERKLAEQFEVSRGTIRKAISELVALGMIEVKAGDGAYVRKACLNSIPGELLPIEPSNFTVSDVITARKALELTAIELTAENISDRQISILEGIINKMAENIDNVPEYIVQDIQFHNLLVEFSSNAVLSAAYKAIDPYHRYLHLATTQNDNCEEISLQHHDKILSALKKRSPSAAKRSLKQHLEEVEQDWLNFSADHNK